MRKSKVKLVFGVINMWRGSKEICTPSIWFWADDDYFSVAVILFIFMFVVRFADRELEERAAKIEKEWAESCKGGRVDAN